MKPKKILLLAVISGLITTFLFYTIMNKQISSASGEEAMMAEVIVAREDIQQNQKITEELLTRKQMPEDQVHAQTARKASDVVGLFATADIKEGESVMLHRVQPSEDEDEFVTKKVTEGHRAVSISVDYVKSVSNLVEPEDFVDVVLSEGTEGETIESKVILENVRVLSVGQRMVEKKSDEPEEEYTAVTLELKQEEAVKLVNGSERGNLQLVLLSEQISEREEKEGASPDTENKTTEHSSYITLPEQSLLREGPGLDYPVSDVISKGSKLKNLNEQKTDDEERMWMFVETPGEKKGWISSRILKQVNE
ncbi:SAF domain-containing protein [Halobacillus dabanensis]|uniref:SAF domain-containing protein n=1 Tax=Halobacillus dabanensis TaxID=240302 RepID=A0A1I3WCD4_HALDA|nr:Flp pilus assembly protein CpaB [Halobacillus dabanensis]SFK04863.1 SAF domain-containing protein [Halobacillus dabanensis]